MNFEKEYSIIKLLHDQLAQEVQAKNNQISTLKTEYHKLAARLPEFDEMKTAHESICLQNQDLQKDNHSKAAYISALQMKLVVAMSEIERLRTPILVR